MKEIIISILLTILMTSFMMTIIFHRFLKQMQDQIDEVSWRIYKMSNQMSSLDNNITDISFNTKAADSHIAKLTNTVANYLNQEQTRRESTFIMPKPDMAKVIEETIKEQIIIEATLGKDMKIVRGDLVDNIINNVEKTYPNVDKEYLAKKVLVKLDEFNETARNT